MPRIYLIAAIFMLNTMSASAQNVGIQFEKMQVGTTLVTQSINGRKRIKFEKYIGREGDFHVVEESTKKGKGPIKARGNTYYDLQGREVKSDWFDGPAFYTPYSCDYVIGECEHTLDYPNPLTKNDNKRTQSTRRYVNRLDGRTFVMSWKLASGKTMEVPHLLGPYNFRVSSRYRNAFGKDRGYDLVELIEPSQDKKTKISENTTPEKQVKAKRLKQKQNFAPACVALYERLRAKTTGDVSKCSPVIKKARFDQCTLPSSGLSQRLPPHVVMILDASGSMAGKVGGKQKMAVAKREATKFLRDVAKDVPIGLIVYGHRGTNKESGKSESCAAVEWALPVGSKRHKVRAGIKGLKPTGWTPIGDALTFAMNELKKLPNADEEQQTPSVVYLISDGKETCDGDPVGAAQALHSSGSKAIVNVIGFDVDAKTRSELEVISQAGGGKYFAAKDSAALSKHLKAAAEAVNSKARFEYCQHLNQGFAQTVYNSASNSVPACFVRESKRKTLDVILKQVKAFTSQEDVACARTVTKLARQARSQSIKEMSKLYRGLLAEGKKAGKAARTRSIEEAKPAQ